MGAPRNRILRVCASVVHETSERNGVSPVAKFKKMADNSDLTLYVKASTISESDFGADVFAQRFMMMLVLKDIPVNISLVDAVKSRTMKKLPALKSQSIPEMIEDPGDIENFIDEIDCISLKCKDDEINEFVLRGHGSVVYHKFCLLAKNSVADNEEKLKEMLRDELHGLNAFLVSKLTPENKFLGGESLLLPDCILLPKLLHTKVVAKVFKDFDIPEEFKGIHDYLEAASGDLAFKRTSPSEETIVDAWARAMKIPNPLLQPKKKKP